MCSSGRSPRATPSHARAIDAPAISQRRHELGEENFADEAIALVQRLADLNDETVRRAQRGDANRGASIAAVEEPMLARPESQGAQAIRRRRR